jgi:predicted ATPase/DNA-binding winged helix-turn-helix (wHTH) protein
VQGETYVFGSFQLHPEERLLLDGDRPTKLGSRALDILVALVKAAGETVSNAEIRSRAWPTTVVDEGSLRVHMSLLRKALGDGQGGNRFIVNVPGRGYRFVAPMTQDRRQLAAATQDPSYTQKQPLSLLNIIGREEEIANVARHLSGHRLVTIVGPGGVGKTAVAIASAAAVKDSFSDGTWFVALDSVDRPDSIVSAIGAALGVAEEGVEPILTWLRNKQALIALDNCEHIIDAAAALAETILRAAPRVRILATSREPLRAQSELSYRLKPFETPLVCDDIEADEALTYAAVQLFAERAQACCGDFVIDDTNALAICQICQGLDGLPLALELAAAQIHFVGVQGLLRTLDDRFALLTGGRRTAMQRQQNLRSTMDWSYLLLSETEKVTLRRIAIFAGQFTLEEATAIASDEQLPDADVIEGLVNLVTKSLITTDVVDDVAYFRLLETTRIYALEKLADSCESERLRRRHAEYYNTSSASTWAIRCGVSCLGRERSAPHESYNRIFMNNEHPGPMESRRPGGILLRYMFQNTAIEQSLSGLGC